MALKVVGGDSLHFRYDGAGRLVRKDVNAAVQAYFLWQGDNLLAELNATATGKVAEYSYYPGLDNPHAIITGTTPYFAHVDGIGNVIALTDSATKTVQHSFDYDVWGTQIGDIDSSAFRARFKGALWLGPQVDVYFMRARWYEPKSGRFLSEDPIGIQGGINPYSYALNDPINASDPEGLEACFDKLTELHGLEKQMNATFSYDFQDGKYCVTDITDLGGSNIEQLFLQWSLGVWAGSPHTFDIDGSWAASLQRVLPDFVLPRCGATGRNLGISLAVDRLLQVGFLRGLNKTSSAGYAAIRYPSAAATELARLRLAGITEAGTASLLWAVSVPSEGAPWLYKAAKATPVVGSGVRLGELMEACGNLISAKIMAR